MQNAQAPPPSTKPALRALHIPGRTPYARKLCGPTFAGVNGTADQGLAVPRDATLPWLNRQASLDCFDVLHIQSLELMPFAAIEPALQRCAREGKGVMATIHDLDPLFPDVPGDFALRVRLACAYASEVVTLTARAGAELCRRFGVDPGKVRVVPHGPVLPLRHPLWAQPPRRNPRFTLGMFGGFRPNRSFLTAAMNALHGLDAAELRVEILSRGLNPVELAAGSEALLVASLAGADPRLRLRLLPFPSDDAIADFVHSLDVLVLPYLYGTHSGQLELAMDLGVAVVAPDLGCYREQWRPYADAVPEPFWFECPEDPYGYGAPLLRALRAAHGRWGEPAAPAADRTAFQAVRAREQAAILDAHAALYARALAVIS
jgi:glycosyltransferase involved in cell wall biosynthesis